MLHDLVAGRRLRGPVAAGLSLLVLAGLGCGGKKATVTGQVSYRGQPLPSGSVNFFGADKNIVGTATIKDGAYAIEDVPVGPVKISVATPFVPPADRRHPPPQDMPGGELPKSVPIPPRYGNPEQSGLVYDVQPGEQEHKIELN